MVKPLPSGIKLVSKADSWLMRAIAFLTRMVGISEWMESFWVTIGRNIYYPPGIKKPENHLTTIAHELVHVRQQQRTWIPIWIFQYVFLPIPVFGAWYRWRYEREAFLVDINGSLGSNNDTDEVIDRYVQLLHQYYFRPWPRDRMRRWFKAHIKDPN